MTNEALWVQSLSKPKTVTPEGRAMEEWSERVDSDPVLMPLSPAPALAFSACRAGINRITA